MRAAVTGARWVLRASALALVALGLAFWSGHLLRLLPLHILLGALFVLGAWALALLAAVKGPERWRGIPLLPLGFAVLALGLKQAALLPGPEHWLIKLMHLGLGIGVLAFADRLAARLQLVPTRPARAEESRHDESARAL